MVETSERSRLELVGGEAPLIAPDEAPPVELVNAEGSAGVLLLCEHAGNLIPRSLGDLGLADEARSSHVAWDPGAAPVARLMAVLLDAPLILQRYSRLVYDCNRPPDAESAMPARSEIHEVPGNVGLSQTARQARTDALYRPFRQQVASTLDRMTAFGRMPALVTLHSFTPVYFGKPREVELGLLHDVDTRLVDAMLDAASAWRDLHVRRNQPYGPEDGVTHSLRVHALPRGLPNAMIELRSDLVETQAQQSAMAARLAGLVTEALGRLPPIEAPRQAGAAR